MKNSKTKEQNSTPLFGLEDRDEFIMRHIGRELDEA